MTSTTGAANSTTAVELAVHGAVASIDDPEYPGVSIVDLGLLERLAVTDGHADVGLIPTFSGCPALAMIAQDVSAAVSAVAGIESVDVAWLRSPAWSVARVSVEARAILADQFTVAVQINGAVSPNCPRCGAATVEQSMFGPSRCRGVHRCSNCSETVEVMRS